MKASELRVGNYINDMFNGRCEVRGITENGIWIRNNGSPAPETVFNPIPLTEEWLVKGGFWKSADFEFQYDSWIVLKLEDNDWNNVSLDVFIKDTYLTCIQYVHQLQNLYASLAYQELTFNLK